MRLSKEKILDAGLEILDSYGLADMTMRRLATHLGVAPGALYWHFSSKQDLIEAIARRIVIPCLASEDAEGSVFKLDPLAWCTVLRNTLLSHRDGAEVVSAAASMTSLHSELLDTLATHLGEYGHSARLGASTFLHFVMGSTALEQSALQAAESTGSKTLPEETDFSRGLDIILAGLSRVDNS